MANTTPPGVLRFTGLELCTPARTPGCLGINDQADPRLCTRLGDTPGCTGLFDGADATLPWWNPARTHGLGPTRASDGTPLALPASAPPPLPARPPWMAIAEQEARKFKGATEAVIEKTTNYATAVGTGQKTLVGDTHPWCAAFVNWCLQTAGVPIDNPGFADHVAAKGRAHGFYEVKGPPVARGGDKGLPMVRNPLFVQLDAPVFGAIAMVTSRDGHGHHVGFAYSQPHAGYVVLLAGNESDRIMFKEDNIAPVQDSTEHLLFFYPAGFLSTVSKLMPLGQQTAVDLNKSFGISTSKLKTGNGTR